MTLPPSAFPTATLSPHLCHFAVVVLYYLKEFQNKPIGFSLLFFCFVLFCFVKLGALKFCHSVSHVAGRLGQRQYVTDFPFSTQWPSLKGNIHAKGGFFIFYCVVLLLVTVVGFQYTPRSPYAIIVN